MRSRLFCFFRGLFTVVDVEQLVAPRFTVLVQQGGDDGVLLRPVEQGGGVRRPRLFFVCLQDLTELL